jgi:hypothetical protein
MVVLHRMLRCKYVQIRLFRCKSVQIVYTTMAPSKTPNLNDQKNPPGSSSGRRRGAGDVCVTRMSSVTSQSQMYKIPLNPTELATSTPTNNVGAFDYAGDENIAAPGSTATTAYAGNGKAYMVTWARPRSHPMWRWP